MTVKILSTAPQYGANVDMGVGKTEAALSLALGFLEAHPKARVLYTVPTHALADELVARINSKAGWPIAAVWKGLSQPDPNHEGRAMCWNCEAVVEALKAGASMKTLCGSRKRGFCPHHPEAGGGCSYRRQGDPSARLWITAHSLLIQAPPSPLKRPKVEAAMNGTVVEYRPDPFDLVVIDEAPWIDLIRGFDRPYGIPLRNIGSIPSAFDENGNGGPDAPCYAAKCRDLEQRLSKLSPGDDRVARDIFKVADLTAEDALEIRKQVFAAKIDVDALLRPGMDKEAVSEAIKEAASLNAMIMRLARFWRLVADFLDGDSDISPNLGLGEVPRPSGSDTGILMRWREDIHPSYANVPILHLDGTMNEPIARQFLPRMKLIADVRATSPHTRRVQVYDSSVSYRKIAPDPNASGKDKLTQENNVRAIGRILEVVNAQLGQRRGLAIMPARTESALAQMGLSSRPQVHAGAVSAIGAVEIIHFGAVAGRDAWREAAVVMIFSRPEIRPRQAEEIAEVVFGRVPQSVGGAWYPKRSVGSLMRDGRGASMTQVYHPDPDVEAVRWQVTEAQLLQAEARARSVRRDATNPVEVLICTSVPLPLEIDALVRWDDVHAMGDPLALMLARGIVPGDYRGIAAVLPDYFRGAKLPEAAARKWFHSHKACLERLKQLLRGEFVPNSHGDILMGVRDKFDFGIFRYRRVGQRKGAQVLIATGRYQDMAGARALAQDLFGPLELFEAAHAPQAEVREKAPSFNSVPSNKCTPLPLHSSQRRHHGAGGRSDCPLSIRRRCH